MPRLSQFIRELTDDVELTAASQHGLGWAERGIHVESMLAEFRALRATVISLWSEQQETDRGLRSEE
jgi:hypothetical protein